LFPFFVFEMYSAFDVWPKNESLTQSVFNPRRREEEKKQSSSYGLGAAADFMKRLSGLQSRTEKMQKDAEGRPAKRALHHFALD
jgi:hypothetical protein